MPSITDDGARVRLFAWALWWTHSPNNPLTQGSGLGGSLSWFMDDGWTADPWLQPNTGQGAGMWFLFYPPRAGVNETGPITSIRWELWRAGLEDAEYFFQLQRLLEAGVVAPNAEEEARAALNAVSTVVWGFPYYSDRLKKGIYPYDANASLADDVRRRVGQIIDTVVATPHIGESAAAGCVLDPALPANLTRHAAVQPLCAGYLDPTLPPYSAVGDGKQDDSAAIQAALDDAYNYRLITRLPANKIFFVTKQLRCVQEGRPLAMREYGYQLIGAGSGASRPIIRLADNAFNVSDGILLYFQLIISADEYPYHRSGPDPPSHYSALLRNVIVDMGANPSVSAVSMSGAQLCSIEDVRIYGQDFKAGVYGLPGSGGYSANICVEGGHIGIWQSSYRPNPSIAGLQLVNQTWVGVLLQSARGPLVLSGFSIAGHGENYTAVRMEGNGADASLALEDGSVQASHVCIDNLPGGGSDISLKNVYFSGAVAVAAPAITIPGLGSAGFRQTTWGVINRWSYSYAGSALNIKGVDIPGGKKQPSSHPAHTSLAPVAGPPPENLVAMHSWSWSDTVPSWGPGIAVADIVRDFGATPSWVNSVDDDAPRIQAALDQACPAGKALAGSPTRVVFVPHGTFHVHSTVFLPAGCALIGAGKHVATISSFQARFPANPVTPVISVRGRASGSGSGSIGDDDSAFVSDIVVQEEIVGVANKIDPATVPMRTLLEVCSGILLRDVRTNREYVNDSRREGASTAAFEPASSVTVVGAGAGKFYGLSLDHVAVPGAVGGALFTANGTDRPVHVYQLSSEHLSSGNGMVVLFKCANVAFHAFKFESAAGSTKKWQGLSSGTGGLMAAHSSHNISVFGGSGNFGIENVNLGSSIFRSWGGDGLDLAALVRKPPPNESAAGKWVRTVDGATVVEVPDKPVALLRFSSSGV